MNARIRISTLLLFLTTTLTLSAQPVVDAEGDIGVGTLASDPSAILDVLSNDKGVLLPRMTTVERAAIVNPAEGLIIYNVDLGTLQTWSDASGVWQWDAVSTTGTNLYWNTIGNGGLTDGIDNLLGTTDAMRVRMIVDGTEQLVLNTNGSLQRDLGGDPRGDAAIDLQVLRNNSDQVVSGRQGVIAGGRDNRVTGDWSVIGGGQENSATAIYTSVVGGQQNKASEEHAAVLGGFTNSATSFGSVVGGGYVNVADGDVAVVVGGEDNRASGSSSFIGGGRGNVVDGSEAVVAGGLRNSASGVRSAIGGGSRNVVTSQDGTVGGGTHNEIFGSRATIAGGSMNIAIGDDSFIGGGTFNHTNDFYASVVGGLGNRTDGRFGVVLGGRGVLLDVDADESIAFHGNNDGGIISVGPRPIELNTPNVALFSNIDFWLANNDGAASAFRFYEANATTGLFPGTTNFTSFEAGAQAADISYILPTTTTATTTIEDGILQLDDATGQLSWVDPLTLGVPAWALAGNGGTTPGTDYIGTNDAQALHLYVNGGAGNSLILNTNGSIQHGATGNARGREAVDLQIGRTSADQVASGRWSTIVGGYQNRATGDYSVAMTARALASGPYSIAMGQNARATAGGAVAIGDIAQATGGLSFALGWNSRASGTYSYALGRNAIASNNYAMVLGASSQASQFGGFATGIGLHLRGESSFGFLANTQSFSRPMQVNAARVAVFGNTDLWLANNDNAASQLRFYEANGTTGLFPSGTNYTGFVAGVQAANITYTLPTAAPATGAGNLGSGLMEATSGGAMSWRGMAVGSANLNFPNTAAGGASDLTITVTGAALGDMVMLGTPNGSLPSGANTNEHYTAWVSAANTVTVRYHNGTAVAATPAVGTFSAMVVRP